MINIWTPPILNLVQINYFWAVVFLPYDSDEYLICVAVRV